MPDEKPKLKCQRKVTDDVNKGSGQQDDAVATGQLESQALSKAERPPQLPPSEVMKKCGSRDLRNLPVFERVLKSRFLI